MAAGLVIVAVFAAVAITVNLFYLGQIQSLVRNTTTTSVMELATARAHYLDRMPRLRSELREKPRSLHRRRHPARGPRPGEGLHLHPRGRRRTDSFKDGSTWCSSSDRPVRSGLEDELFTAPAMAGETGSSKCISATAANAASSSTPHRRPCVTAGPGRPPHPRIGATSSAPSTSPTPPTSCRTPTAPPIPALAPPSSSTPPAPSCSTPTAAPTRRSRAAFRPSSTTNADSSQVSSLLAGIASDTSGSLVMTPLDGADQFVFYTPLAPSGWSLVTILPLSGGGIRRHADRRHHQPDGGRARRGRGRGGGGHGGPHGTGAAASTATSSTSRAYSAIGAKHRHRHLHRRSRAPHRPSSRTPRTSSAFRPVTSFVLNELSPNGAYANVAAIVHPAPAIRRAPPVSRRTTRRWAAPVAAHDGAARDARRAREDHLLAHRRHRRPRSAPRLRRAATAAEDANRAKARSSSMSHDIRTP